MVRLDINKLYKQVITNEISKDKFLYEVRKNPVLKKWVSNLTGYNDAITILKNKGFLVEKSMSPKEWESAKETERLEKHPEKKTIKKVQNLMSKEKKHAKPVKETAPEKDMAALDKAINSGKVDVNKVRAAAEKAAKGDTSELVKIMLDANKLINLQESKKRDYTPETVNPYLYKQGLNYELHLVTSAAGDAILTQEVINKAKSKVFKNLAKDLYYYHNKINGTKDTVDNDGMVEFTGKNKLDKSNELKKAKKQSKDTANVKDTLGKKEASASTVKVKTMKDPGANAKMKKFSLKEAIDRGDIAMYGEGSGSFSDLIQEILSYLQTSSVFNLEFKLNAIEGVKEVQKLFDNQQYAEALELVFELKDRMAQENTREYEQTYAKLFDSAELVLGPLADKQDFEDMDAISSMKEVDNQATIEAEKKYLQTRIKSDQNRLSNIQRGNPE